MAARTKLNPAYLPARTRTGGGGGLTHIEQGLKKDAKAVESDMIAACIHVRTAFDNLAKKPGFQKFMQDTHRVGKWLADRYHELKAKGIEITQRIHTEVLKIIHSACHVVYHGIVTAFRDLETFWKRVSEVDKESVELANRNDPGDFSDSSSSDGDDDKPHSH